MATVKITGIQWTKEPVLFQDMPKVVKMEVDDDLLSMTDDVEEYLRYELSEGYVFTPYKIGGYEILAY